VQKFSSQEDTNEQYFHACFLTYITDYFQLPKLLSIYFVSSAYLAQRKGHIVSHYHLYFKYALFSGKIFLSSVFSSKFGHFVLCLFRIYLFCSFTQRKTFSLWSSLALYLFFSATLILSPLLETFLFLHHQSY
jgi:hypothetical protein